MQDKKKKLDWKFLLQFAMDDFKNKYAGSLLGVGWAFVKPLTTIIIYWFVFQLGFHSQPVDGYPYVLWLVSGLIPWFFISDAVVLATPSLGDYNYLVKKVLFHIDILPLGRIFSCFYVQLFLVAFTIVFFMLFGYFPDFYYLQLPYYMLYMLILITGLGYLSAALYPFLKDLLQLISIGIQLVFWLTPIVWEFDMMPAVVQRLLALNPFYYIVEGFRAALIYKKPFWENWQTGIYYWAVALVFLGIGRKVFNKMKTHFADVL